MLREKVHECFDMREQEDSPYMLLVADIHDSQKVGDSDALAKSRGLEKLSIERSKIQAVTHVDHSAPRADG